MSFLGGIMKSIVNPMSLAQLAMGPAGWASILAKAVISAVGQQVIQQIGQKLGLPDGVIDMAQQAFSGAMGGAAGQLDLNSTIGRVAKQAGLNAFQEGSLQRQAADIVDKATKDTVQDFINKINRQQTNKQQGDGDDIEAIMKGKGSILMKIATAMGKIADKKMNDMADKTEQLGKFGEVTGKNQGQYAELTGQMQALGQEMSMISQAMANVIKTVGESASTVARK